MKPDQSPESKVYVPERMARDVSDDARSCTAGLKMRRGITGMFSLNCGLCYCTQNYSRLCKHLGKGIAHQVLIPTGTSLYELLLCYYSQSLNKRV